MKATLADIKAEGAREFDQVIRELGACQLTGLPEYGIGGERFLRLDLPDQRLTLVLQFSLETVDTGSFLFSILALAQDGVVSSIEVNADIDDDGVEWVLDSTLTEGTVLESLRQHLRLKFGRDGYPVTSEQSLAAIRTMILFYRDHVPSPILT